MCMCMRVCCAYHWIREVPGIVGIGLWVLEEVRQKSVEALLVLHPQSLEHALGADEVGFF